MWAEQTHATIGSLHPRMVPYDLLTDKEKKDNREMSQELLKYLTYEGYNVYKFEEQENISTSGGLNSSTSRSKVTSFASSLLTKLLQYLEATSLSLKLLKPSENFSRRMSFKQEIRDIKFFSKVVLPLVERLFQAHRQFFLNSLQPSTAQTAQASVSQAEQSGSQESGTATKQASAQTQQLTNQTFASQAGGSRDSMATPKEKEMVAQLFCKFTYLR